MDCNTATTTASGHGLPAQSPAGEGLQRDQIAEGRWVPVGDGWAPEPALRLRTTLPRLARLGWGRPGGEPLSTGSMKPTEVGPKGWPEEQRLVRYTQRKFLLART
jgi:hypothetical protein